MTPTPLGLIGSLLLIIGSALPARATRHPIYSSKNWLFASGNICMFCYSVLNYMNDGSLFFVLLQILVLLSTLFMMLNTQDVIDVIVITIATIALSIWSLTLFEGYRTILFVIGLGTLSTGFVLENGTRARNIALSLGSIFIGIFSYLTQDWIFLWLNVFFAGCCAFHALRKIEE